MFVDSSDEVIMPNSSESLLKAILDDNRVGVKTLLKTNPRLALEGVKTARLAWELPHWIYVGDTPLHAAGAGYRVEIAKMLLAAGADVNAAKNHRRGQPLHYAADGYSENPAWDPKKQVAMIRLLLDAGADIAAQDKNGATPLHRAVRTRCAAAVNCLLNAGADATIRNLPGSTPFHLAVQNTGRGGSGSEKAKTAQREIIETFLKRGISTALKDANGKSVLQWAKNDSIRKMLSGERHGWEI
jgi:ankyrin repeat protein